MSTRTTGSTSDVTGYSSPSSAAIHSNEDSDSNMAQTIDTQHQKRKSHGSPGTSFLELPAELRLRIYDHALVRRFDAQVALGIRVDSTQKHVLLHMIGMFQNKDRNTTAGLLRTCKQIYYETIPILYSQNIFRVIQAEDMLRFMDCVGLTNVAHMKRIHIWVSYQAQVEPWTRLFGTLAEKATGLRHLEVGWGVEESHHELRLLGAKARGLGDNIDFVRALAQIRGLQKIVIDGYYAKNWPEYLERETGAHVQNDCGLCQPLPDLTGYDLTDVEIERQMQYVEELNKTERNLFMDYQKGTEDLMP